jgi:hypothetical protein
VEWEGTGVHEGVSRAVGSGRSYPLRTTQSTHNSPRTTHNPHTHEATCRIGFRTPALPITDYEHAVDGKDEPSVVLEDDVDVGQRVSEGRSDER